MTAADAFALLCAEYPAARRVLVGANHYAVIAALPDASCWLHWVHKQNDSNVFADAELAWTNHPGAVRIFRHMWNGMLRASQRGKRVHPTQKPSALAEWALNLVDPKAERKTVSDVFGGSGSTLIAAHPHWLGGGDRGVRACILQTSLPRVGKLRRASRLSGYGLDGTTEPVSFT